MRVQSFNNNESIGSIRIIIQGGNIFQLHYELQKLSANEISGLLLQLDPKEQYKLWSMVPIQ